MTQTAAASRSGVRTAEVVVRVLVVTALAIDAVVHLRLAGQYQLAAPGGIGAGNLFRVASVAAVLAGLWLLLRGTRAAYAVSGLILLSAFVAVLLYRYVEIPALGPIPSMYEPVWFFEKTLSAVAEGVGALLAGVGFALGARRRHD